MLRHIQLANQGSKRKFHHVLRSIEVYRPSTKENSMRKRLALTLGATLLAATALAQEPATPASSRSGSVFHRAARQRKDPRAGHRAVRFERNGGRTGRHQ